MRSKSITIAVLFSGALLTCLDEGTAHAQIPQIVERDPNWEIVGNVSMGIGLGSVIVMPRVYYSSPVATVGWKARWHISALAPIMSMTGLALLLDGPIKTAIQKPKDGCTVEQTLAKLPDSGCESFGMPSTHAFASWGATGAGLGIFLMDTIKWSNGHFHVGSFIGNVAVPFTASIMTSVSRSADGSGLGFEDTPQVVLGAVPGVIIGAALGLSYAYLQEPDCGYGNYLICW
jgi:hypothetical protein